MKRTLCVGCLGLFAVLQSQAQLLTATPWYDEQFVQPNFVDVDASVGTMPGGLPLFGPRVTAAWQFDTGGVIPFDEPSPIGFQSQVRARYGVGLTKVITFTDNINLVIWQTPLGPTPISASPHPNPPPATYDHALHLNLQPGGQFPVWGWAPTLSLSAPGESVAEIGFTVLSDPTTPQLVTWSVSLKSGAVVPVAAGVAVPPSPAQTDTFFGYTAPVNDPIVSFNLSVLWQNPATTSDAMYIDDLAFVTVPEPQDAALLLAFGLAGYACIRRRAAIAR